MVSIYDLLEVVHGLKPLLDHKIQDGTAEIRRLENRHDVIFSAEGGLIWITFRRLLQNNMSTAVIGRNRNQM